ncbi:MAG: glutamyl-tRNA reductase [Fusicatenibacter sp.]|nr:glutamyl-tRNA reductase [Lachnospiraceae bacterium]MDY2937491.1 glutamyl-tRNA reductase [Fusicatenibacter sp.]
MSIRMIGIDHSLADVDLRARFSFTQKAAAEAERHFKELEGIRGCVLLSTCNRMELWVSADDECECDLLALLCGQKGLDPSQYRESFIQREEHEAVEHLFHLTCGLKSMILAEDQIISQVKNALSLSRENYCTDNVLEVLFRGAITAAKRVKTEVTFTHASLTAMDRAVAILLDEGMDLHEKTCMVIGNGEMGKLAAMTLKRAGADVTVTVRQYRSGVVTIPPGCKRINYGERMDLFPRCDIVVSATSSPNCTIRKELLENLVLSHPIYLIDLAVPRDIEPSVGDLEQITLYDIDDFSLSKEDGNEEALKKAERILSEEMDEFYRWYRALDLVPRMKEIESDAVEDLNLRINRILRKLPLSEEEQETLKRQIDTAAGKVVNKMMFCMKDSMERDHFLECVSSLEQLYEKKQETKECNRT